jgi:beta-galactosidase
MLLIAAPGRGAQTVRVDSNDGAPRILVDGKPVRARIFFGSPGSRALPVALEGKTISFDFVAEGDAPSSGTLHFRFGAQPGDIWLDDLTLVDLDGKAQPLIRSDFEAGSASFDRDWTHWPVGAANNVGTISVEPGGGRDGSAGLHISLHAPADGNWPDFHIYHVPNLSIHRGHHYRVSFWARANPARRITVALYRPGEPYTLLGGAPGAFSEQVQLAATAGVRFVSFPVNLTWPQPGEPEDWSAVDAAYQRVLNANTDALLLPRVSCSAPAWWLAAHPDDQMVWDNGPHKAPHAIPSSADFRRDCAARLAALIEHSETAFGAHIAGYHPIGQNTGEWFYQDTWLTGLNGYSKGDERDWRNWLKHRYPDPAALQAAWGNPKANADNATVPSPAERRAAPLGVLLDPHSQRPVIDFAEFQQESMVDCVAALAAAARHASAGKKLVLFFYGYGFEFSPVQNGPATSGHYALRRLLQSPDIDVFCSPISYFDRGLGGNAPAMSAAESVAVAGKMWLYEDDTYTFLATGTPPGYADRVETLEQTEQELLRNTGECAVRNFATWWMDLGGTGWFDDPGLWHQMSLLAALDEPLLQSPRPYRPEVAAVLDERGMLSVAAGAAPVAGRLISVARRTLGRMGAPYGQYLFDDVAAGSVRAKMFVMLDPWSIDHQQAERLLNATHGALRIWCYAPGLLSGESEKLTGFHLEPAGDVAAWAEPTALGRSLGLSSGLGMHSQIKPLLAASDARDDETMARYSNGAAAIALRQTSEGQSLFVGVPGLSSELLRLAARKASVHLYSQTDCNVYANGPFMVLHADHTGPLTIDTGRDQPVTDLLTAQIIGRGPMLPLQLEKGQTRVLRTGAE